MDSSANFSSLRVRSRSPLLSPLVAVLGLLFTAIVFMRMMQSLFSGPLAESCGGFADLGQSEKLVILPVTLLMFAIGIAPQFLFNIFNSTVATMARLFA